MRDWLHAHFIHTPASVDAYASLMHGHWLELLGACQGHLDVARLGARGASWRRALGRDLHRAGFDKLQMPQRPIRRGCI